MPRTGLSFLAILAACVIGPGTVTAQAPVPQLRPPPPAAPVFGGSTLAVIDPAGTVSAGPRMDFHFERVPLEAAIKDIQRGFQKASDGKPLNVVVPDHLRDLVKTNLVSLDVKQVTADEALNLLGMTSQRMVQYVSGYNYNNGVALPLLKEVEAGYHFNSAGFSGGTPTYLLQATFPPTSAAPDFQQAYRTAATSRPPPEAPKVVQFYQLEPYLERLKVEDITTAVKTGWDLAGLKTQPTMKFHEETKLLVVAGDQEQLGIVSQVLQMLNVSPRPPQSLPPPRRVITQPPQALPPPTNQP